MVEQNDERDRDAAAQQPPTEPPKPANDADSAESADSTVAGETPSPDARALEAQALEAEREAAELRERLLRALAETENVRRRGERETEDMRKYAVGEFARDLLGVADNLRRALDSVSERARQENPELAAFLEGVELTERELLKALEKHEVRPVEALGRKLDPNLHQAVTQLDHPEAEAGEIVQVFQTGYTIADRLLRPAMVAVAKGRAVAPEDAPQRVDTRA